MELSNQLKNQHLLWRTGFGPSIAILEHLERTSRKSLFKSIIKASLQSPAPIDVADNALKNMIMMPTAEDAKMQKRDLSAEEKKQLRKQSEQDIKNLNIAWLNEMVHSEAQLREKMSLFWHGHFASRNENIFYQQLLLDILRTNALGNFGDLLRKVSKSAAMINFLNNNQNRKNHPNENFAREVMELFTMGRGNYTEQDVKEAARAFTGWGADLQGEFAFRKNQHDDGEKTFLGRTGNFDGDDVLNMLLQQKQTALFIVKKIWRFFVNDQLDENKIAKLADSFYRNNYDIAQLMEEIFTSQWFYDEKNIAAKIKSPVELIVGIRRILPMKIENEESQLLMQRLLGQLLFFPPNVAGWPGGTNWIDSSTLMFRLKIPQIIYTSDEIHLQPKDDDDQMMGMRDTNDMQRKYRQLAKAKAGKQIMDVTIDWNGYIGYFKKTERENLTATIEQTILLIQPAVTDITLQKYTNTESRENFIKTTTIQLMSTPEYQLC
jgi:uncharacterized protein (DUF1800 family)